MTPNLAPALTADDESHLNLLAIGHYVMGGLTVLCGFFPFIHLAVGIGMLSGELDLDAPAPMGAMFVAIATALIGFFWVTAGLTIYAGRCLRARRKRTLCLITAAISCIFFQPVGLALGIFTIIVLMRPQVTAVFRDAQPTSGPAHSSSS